jgi:arylsulfatase
LFHSEIIRPPHPTNAGINKVYGPVSFIPITSLYNSVNVAHVDDYLPALNTPSREMRTVSSESVAVSPRSDTPPVVAPAAASQFLALQLKSLQDFPPRQGADSLSMKKAIDNAMKKMDNPGGASD